MSRKRFIKLMMGHGYSREYSKVFANMGLLLLGNYADTWREIMRAREVLRGWEAKV